MSKIPDFSGGMLFHMQLNGSTQVRLLRLSITINFTKEEDYTSQLGEYDEPFYEQQYTHGSCYISLFKFKSFDQFSTPKLPQILDIYLVVPLYEQAKTPEVLCIRMKILRQLQHL